MPQRFHSFLEGAFTTTVSLLLLHACICAHAQVSSISLFDHAVQSVLLIEGSICIPSAVAVSATTGTVYAACASGSQAFAVGAAGAEVVPLIPAISGYSADSIALRPIAQGDVLYVLTSAYPNLKRIFMPYNETISQYKPGLVDYDGNYLLYSLCRAPRSFALSPISSIGYMTCNIDQEWTVMAHRVVAIRFDALGTRITNVVTVADAGSCAVYLGLQVQLGSRDVLFTYCDTAGTSNSTGLMSVTMDTNTLQATQMQFYSQSSVCLFGRIHVTEAGSVYVQCGDQFLYSLYRLSISSGIFTKLIPSRDATCYQPQRVVYSSSSGSAYVSCDGGYVTRIRPNGTYERVLTPAQTKCTSSVSLQIDTRSTSENLYVMCPETGVSAIIPSAQTLLFDCQHPGGVYIFPGRNVQLIRPSSMVFACLTLGASRLHILDTVNASVTFLAPPFGGVCARVVDFAISESRNAVYAFCNNNVLFYARLLNASAFGSNRSLTVPASCTYREKSILWDDQDTMLIHCADSGGVMALTNLSKTVQSSYWIFNASVQCGVQTGDHFFGDILLSPDQSWLFVFCSYGNPNTVLRKHLATSDAQWEPLLSSSSCYFPGTMYLDAARDMLYLYCWSPGLVRLDLRSKTVLNFAPPETCDRARGLAASPSSPVLYAACQSGSARTFTFLPDGQVRSTAIIRNNFVDAFFANSGSNAVISLGQYSTQAVSLVSLTCGFLPGYSVQNGECTPCAAGAYRSLSNGTDHDLGICLACQPGTVAPNRGTAVCGECGTGSYSRGALTAGTGSALICFPCAPGTIANTTRSRVCDDCSPGRYVNISGASACVQCTPGSYAAGSGNARCISCPQVLGFTIYLCKH